MRTQAINSEREAQGSDNRGHAVVAVCDSVLLKRLHSEMQRFLGARFMTESVTHVVDTSPSITRVKFEFECASTDDRRLIDTVRHLCTLPGVRYIRLYA